VAHVGNRARLVDHGERELRATALDLAEAALAALSPAAGLRRSVALDGENLVAGGRSYDLSAVDRLVVLGAGKASAEAAQVLEQMLGPRLSGGVVVVPRSAGVPTRRVTLMEADHPIPGPASADGARALLKQAEDLGEHDLAICVFTGGSSALASLPPPEVTLADKIRLHQLLLASGMSIVEINTVRKHVSAIKGGRLARAIAPARILNLTVSDVVGDPLDCITDPTVQDTSSVADALSALREWSCWTGSPPRCGTTWPAAPTRSRPTSVTPISKACWRCGVRTAATRSPGPRHPGASPWYGWAGRSRGRPPRSAGCSRHWRGKREPAARRGRGARSWSPAAASAP